MSVLLRSLLRILNIINNLIDLQICLDVVQVDCASAIFPGFRRAPDNRVRCDGGCHFLCFTFV